MESEINSILIVEGTTDAQFIEAIIRDIHPNHRTLDVLGIVFDKLYASDVSALTKKLLSLQTDLRAKPITKLGIILDKDDYSMTDRINMLNQAFVAAYYSIQPFTATINQIVYDINSKRSIDISYFIVKDGNDKGNIETLLTEIVNFPKNAADCLEVWKKCCESKGINIKSSDYYKEWIKFYLRYDYCLTNKNKLAKHASEYCTPEKSFENMNKDEIPKPWDFKHPVLDELKTYLQKFL